MAFSNLTIQNQFMTFDNKLKTKTKYTTLSTDIKLYFVS